MNSFSARITEVVFVEEAQQLRRQLAGEEGFGVGDSLTVAVVVGGNGRLIAVSTRTDSPSSASASTTCSRPAAKE